MVVVGGILGFSRETEPMLSVCIFILILFIYVKRLIILRWLILLRRLEKEMLTYFSILAWRIPQTEEPGWVQSTGSTLQRRTTLEIHRLSQQAGGPGKLMVWFECQQACDPGRADVSHLRLKAGICQDPSVKVVR